MKLKVDGMEEAVRSLRSTMNLLWMAMIGLALSIFALAVK